MKVSLKVSSTVGLLCWTSGREGQGGRLSPCRCSSPDEHLQLRHQGLHHADTSKHSHTVHCSVHASINRSRPAKSHWLGCCIHNTRHCCTRDDSASIAMLASLQLACLFNTVSRRSAYSALTSPTLFISVR